MTKKVSDLNDKAAERLMKQLDEGKDLLLEIPEEKRIKIYKYIMDLLLHEIRKSLDGELKLSEAPFFAEVNRLFEECKPQVISGCYFCDKGIDGNATPFSKETKICIACQLKLANAIQAFGINPQALFPGIRINKKQEVLFEKGAKEYDEPSNLH